MDYLLVHIYTISLSICFTHYLFSHLADVSAATSDSIYVTLALIYVNCGDC